jgi:hypothetical protein
MLLIYKLYIRTNPEGNIIVWGGRVITLKVKD